MIKSYTLVTIFISIFFLNRCLPDHESKKNPNIIIIYTDDHRYDGLGIMQKNKIFTPNMDLLASEGLVFKNAFVTLSICSPSRAALLTGRYGSSNGVTSVGHLQKIKQDEITLAEILRNNGYITGITGKWHLKNNPKNLGFDYAVYCLGNGPYYRREFIENGEKIIAEKYIEEFIVDKSLQFIKKAETEKKPYFLFHCTQVPHMNHRFDWNVKEKTLIKYNDSNFTIPLNWYDSLEGKPAYLSSSRSRQQALKYGYGHPDSVIHHMRKYYASLTEMDQEIGRLINYIKDQSDWGNTIIILMGDNGWFLGEHQFTSKVLPYEESIRVPLIVSGSGIPKGFSESLVLNIDVFPTLMDILKLPMSENLHGISMLPIFQNTSLQIRDHVFYEAPDSQLGSYPLYAIRNNRWKYIQTFDPEEPDQLMFEELYDLKSDPSEIYNLVDKTETLDIVSVFRILMYNYLYEPSLEM